MFSKKIRSWSNDRRRATETAKARKAFEETVKALVDNSSKGPLLRTFWPFGRTPDQTVTAKEVVQSLTVNAGVASATGAAVPDTVAAGILAQVVYGLFNDSYGSLKAQKKLKNYLPNERLSFVLATDENAPRGVKQDIDLLQKKLRVAILATAAMVEIAEIKSGDELIRTEPEASLRARGESFLSGQSSVRVTHSAIFVAIDAFYLVNKKVLEKIETAERSGDSKEFTRLAYINGAICAEVANFMANYLDSFGLEGIDEIRAVKRTVWARLDEYTKMNQTSRETFLSSDSDVLQEAQTRMSENIMHGEANVRLVKARWEEIRVELEKLHANVKEAKGLANTFRAMAHDAQAQLLLIEAGSLTGMMRKNLAAMSKAMDIEKIKLKKLDKQSFDLLLGRSSVL